jgi:AcrR family transcriptional regulator
MNDRVVNLAGSKTMRTKTPKQAEKMLDAAAQLFGGQRFHEVRMEDIASKAAVGKGTLYRYFSDKEDLYLALLARASEEFQKRIRDAVDQQTDFREKLVAFVQSGIAFFDERPHLGPLIQRAEVSRGEESPWQPTRTKVTNWVIELFSQAEAAGSFKIRDPKVAGYMLLGGLRSVVLFSPKPRPFDIARKIVGDFLDGAAE